MGLECGSTLNANDRHVSISIDKVLRECEIYWTIIKSIL